jgi:hypothetical protein
MGLLNSLDMGLFNLLRKNKRTRLMRLPSGSFTLDPVGNVMTSTLPQTFPIADIHRIGQSVLAAFNAAKKFQMPLTELIINYAALRILARELGGGAIVFLMPQAVNQSARLTKTS